MAQVARMRANNQTVGGGILMDPDDSYACEYGVDITERLHTVLLCPVCEKYSLPPRTWTMAKSKLLKLCIRMLKKNLNIVEPVQAQFIQTEPDSKRIKVKLTFLQEVLSKILEMSYIIEFVVLEQMCVYCSRVQAIPDRVQDIHDQLAFAVQLRQDVSHRGTFFHLEQLILKHDAAVDCIRIKQVDQGLDFFFPSEGCALKFVEFLATVVPVECDLSSFCDKPIEICPICPGDLICLPEEVAADLDNLGPLVICTKITDCIVLMDPFTMEHRLLDGAQYWRLPFKPLLSRGQLEKYVVIDISDDYDEFVVCGTEYLCADALIAREKDYQRNSTCFDVKTHLGDDLYPEDVAFGYDLTVVKGNNIELLKDKDVVLPDVVLIKKCYDEDLKNAQPYPRQWVLKRLDIEVDDEEEMKTEYEKFLEEVETNLDIWPVYNFYLNKDYDPSVNAKVAKLKKASTSPDWIGGLPYWRGLIDWRGLPPFPVKLLQMDDGQEMTTEFKEILKEMEKPDFWVELNKSKDDDQSDV